MPVVPKSVVVDADSHLQPSLQWMEKQFPDMKLPTREATSFSPVKYFVPEEFWPEDEEDMYAKPWFDFLNLQRDAIAKGIELDDMMADERNDLGALHRLFHGAGAWDADDRVGVLDQIGVDHQLVSGVGLGLSVPGVDPHLLMEVTNTITCEQLARHSDRLIPITVVDFTDLDWTVQELTRVRAMGSRAFSIPVQPVDGKSLCHPHFDRVWAAASDLGMVGYLHSFAEPYDAAWCNNGGDFLQLTMLSSVRYHHQAELLSTVLIGGGVFARFPKFGVVMAEIGGLAWIPNMLQWIDAVACDPTMHAMEGVQDWRWPLKPSEYAQRQLRVAPLPNQAQKASPWLEVLGDIAVFSTDYPHPEGTPDPAIQGPEAAVDFFRDDLADADPIRRDRFFGESLAELFARSGDPLRR